MSALPDPLTGLRDRLHEMRVDLVSQLAEADVLDAGLLRLLADVDVVLAGLDHDGERLRR